MSLFRKIIFVIIDLLLAFIVIWWTYNLYREFVSLPDKSELMKFSIFQIKLFVFSFFLIACVSFIWFTTSLKKPSSEPLDNKRMADIEEKVSQILSYVSKGEAEELFIEKGGLILSEIEKISDARSVDELFSSLFRIARKLTNSKRMSIELFDFSDQELKLVRTEGFKPTDRFVSISSNPPSRMVFESGKKLFVTNIESHPFLARKNNPIYSKKSFMIFPITMFGINFGVFNLSEKETENGVYKKEEFETISFLVTLFSLKLENILLYYSLEDLLEKSRD